MRFSRLFYSLILLFYIPFFTINVTSASAVNLKLGWLSNTEPDLQGYQVCYGTEAGRYTTVVDIVAPVPVNGVVFVDLLGLSPFLTYYLSVRAYNNHSEFSSFSSEMVWSYQRYVSGSEGSDIEVFVSKDYLNSEENNCFSSITQGYHYVEDVGVIYILVDDYIEDLYFNLDKYVTLSGGWVGVEGSYLVTNVCGSMTICKGTVEVESLIISGH